MLKTPSTKSTEPRKGGVRVGGNRRAECDGSELNGNGMNNVEVDGNKIGDNEVRKRGRKTSKNLSKSKKTIGSDFFIPKARLAFTKLKQAFVKALILYHFDLECHIQVETDVLGYAISGVFS